MDGGQPSTESEADASSGRGTIVASEVTKRFEGGVAALDGVSLDARPGEFVSIVGSSGCGKSTMLRLIAGLVPATGGTIHVNGSPVEDPRQDVGLMFQRPTLLPWRTALENTVLPRQLQNRGKPTATQEAYELLALLGLGGFEHTYPRHLSGGMQQRVALARLLVIGVDILLLDEPFAAVDQLTRERLNTELLSIHERTSSTVVLVTHNITEAITLADRVIVMTPRPGRVAETLEVPFDRPRTPAITEAPEFRQLAFQARECLEDVDHPETTR